MNNIYSFLKNVYLKTNNSNGVSQTLTFALALVLMCIPLPVIFGSISSMLFIFLYLVLERKKKFNSSFALFLPILLFFLMMVSLFWSIDFTQTKNSLQKEILMLLFPIVFLFYKKYNKKQIYQSIEIYSFFMAGFAVFKLVLAIYKYMQTKNIKVFFYHELVSLDLNAIYVATFASFALFYFLQLSKKSNLHQICIAILTLFVFLLSSKSIIFIDIILIIYFYARFAFIPKSVKFFTISTVLIFVFSSLFFVKQIRNRFLIEYQTAFVDNTVNTNTPNATIYNVSINQAWNNKVFYAYNYFPGGALRVYQFRIFCEMITSDQVFFYGYGHNASQSKIKEKEVEHHLYKGYGDFNFHNQYVQTFAELGFFGFWILSLMVFINLNNAFRSKDFLHIVFAVTMFVLFLTESLLCRQRGIVFFITLYCLFNSVKSDS